MGNTNDTRIIHDQPASQQATSQRAGGQQRLGWYPPSWCQEVNSVPAGTNPAGAPIPFRPPLSSDAVGGWGSRSSVRKEWGNQLGGYQPGRSSPPGTSLVGTSRVAVDLLPSGWSLAGWLALFTSLSTSYSAGLKALAQNVQD